MHAPLNPALPGADRARLGSGAGPDVARFLHEVREGITPCVRTMLTNAVQALESSDLRHLVAGDRQHTLPAIGLLKARGTALAQQISTHLLLALGQAGQAPAGADSAASAVSTADIAPPGLSLIEEAQIDEDIEIGRLVRDIESTAESELQSLAALFGGLRGLPFVDIHAVPLPPLACARALRAGVEALSPEPGVRGLLLRHLGEATGQQMKATYAAHADLLARWGVAPAPFRVKLGTAQDRPADTGSRGWPVGELAATPTASGELDPAAPAGSALPAPEDRPSPKASLERLVAHARRPAGGEPPAPGSRRLELPDPDGPLLRLAKDLRPMGAAPAAPALPATPAAAPKPALGRDAATRLMERLFRHLETQVAMSDHSRALLLALRAPGLALAAGEPQLWDSMDHPWWKLLDRLIALGAAHADDEAAAAADPISAALGQVVLRMGRAPTADRRAWQAASDEVQAAARRDVAERMDALGPEAGQLQSEAELQELEAELRSQITQQLRSTPVCPRLRQFLVGPWTQALARTAQHHGPHSTELSNLALVVDDLIHATQEPGKRVSSAQRAVLLRQTRAGLAASGLPPSRAEAELADLVALLRNPPAVQAEEWAEPVSPLPLPYTLDLHAALPTVPIEMGADPAGEPPRAGSTGWCATLTPGAHCRLFMLGRWMTVQLVWVSETGSLFLFNSRHGGRVHSLTRRMLQKLRAAGLATHIEDGLLLAQAMDTLVDSQLAAG